MTALEIVLVIIGIIFFLGSYLVTEKLSSRDLKQIASLSEAEISTMIEKELKNADGKISDKVDEAIDQSVSKVQRQMDKETNEKMMAINEYSETVLESIRKSHDEVVFLYSMLNDKHDELTSLAGDLNQLEEKARQVLSDRDIIMQPEKKEESLPEEPLEKPEQEEQEELENHNRQILGLFHDGRTQVEIARELGLGLGEVKLVIDLYQGE